jgi:hypothetical protein
MFCIALRNSSVQGCHTSHNLASGSEKASVGEERRRRANQPADWLQESINVDVRLRADIDLSVRD